MAVGDGGTWAALHPRYALTGAGTLRIGAAATLALLGGAGGFTYAHGALTVKDAGKTDAVLHFSGNYVRADFSLTADEAGGTLIKFD